MKSYIPRSSHSNLRVFNACLLSFLMIMMPLATLAASMRSSAPSTLPASAAKPQPVQTENETKPVQAETKSESQHPSSTSFFNFFMPVGTVTATLTDSFPDPNGDGLADKGETITYTATINNGTASPVTSVEFQDTPDANTTLVGGSINVSPLAADDSYDTVANTLLEVGVAASGNPAVRVTDPTKDSVFDNDKEFLGDTFTFDTITVNPTKGTLTFNSDGTFSYQPNANQTGTDTFTYRIKDSQGLTDTATVTININATKVWYVKNNVAGPGTGTSSDPFKSLASASAASAAGDTIYISNGDGTTSQQNAGITMKANQRLIGEATQLDVPVSLNGGPNPTVLKAATANYPKISGTTEGVSILNVTGVLVSGLNIAGTNAGSNAIDATTNAANSGGVEVANCIISAAGAEGIDVNGGGTGTMTVSIHNNSVTATGNGIDIARTAGSVNVIALNDNTVTGTTGGAGINVVGTGAAVLFDATAGGAYNTVSFGTTAIGTAGAGNGVGTNGIVLNNVAGDISFTDLDVFTDNGTALFVVGTNANFNAGTATGTRITANTGTPTLTAVGGAALDVTSANINLGSNTAISSTNSASTGVSLAQTSGTFNGASGSSITNATGIDFSVNGGSNASANVGVSYAGTITDDVGQLVNIQNVTASSTHTFSGLITDNFDGDGTEQGISLTGNTGANITFSGGINIRTTTNAAFTSTGAGGTGTLTITDPAGATSNKLQTTTGTALNVANTIIGSNGLTFESITAGTAASGPSNGIILNTTGSQGGLTVTGTGSAGTGGTIQKTTGDGVSLNSTEKLSLSWMNIQNNLGSGIGGGTINGFQLDHCTISTNGDSAATDESGINVTQLIGSASGGSRPTSITNCTFQNNWEFQIQITNSSGTLTDLTMSSNTISNNGANGIVGDLFNFLGNGTASMKLSLTSGTFTGNAPATATAVSSVTQGSGTHTVNVSGATFTNNNVGVDCSTTNASTTFNCNVSNNTFTGSRAQAINSFHNGNSPFTRTFNGTFNNNIIGTLGVAGSGSAVGRGIDIDNEGAINATYTVSGNTIQEITNFEGISVQTGLGGSTTAGGLTQVTITNNTIRNINASRGLIVQELQDATKPPFPTLCANISGNSFSGIAGQAGNGQFMRVKEGSGTVNVTQATPTAAANASELDDANGFNDPTKISIGGAPSFSQPACAGSSAMLNIQSNGSNEQLAQAGDALQNSGAQPLFSLLGIKAELASVVAEFSNHPQTVATEQTSIGTQSSWLAALTATGERNGAHENADSLIQPGVALTHDQSGFASADISEESGVTSIASQDKSEEYGAQIVKASYQPVAEELGGDTGRADVAARDTRLGHARSRSARGNNSVKSSELSNVASPLPPTPVDVVIGTLPAGKSVTIKFQVTVNNPPTSPANATSVQTQGLVLFNSGSSIPTDDPATVASNDATVTPLGRSDLAVTGVTDNATTTTPTSTQTYVISYSNPGRSTTGVVLSETVPVGTTFNSGPSSPGWACAPNNNAGSICTNTIGALAHNASSTNNFAVMVNSPAASGLNTISDTASISGDTSYEADINPANDSASDTTTLNAAPAFGTFTVDDGTASTTPGSSLTYTITFKQTGDQDADGVVLTETVPAGTTFNAGGSTGGWTETPSGSGIYKLNIGSVPASAVTNHTATFAVTVNNPVGAGIDNIVNNASIADDGTNTSGVPVTANASDTDTLNAVPDLSITKSPDVTNASADTVITYTLNYANGGNQAATGVVVTETVPANTNFVAAGSSTWSCADNSPAGTSCTNTVGALAGNGAGGSLTFKVKVVNPVPGGTTQITNTATIDDDHANGTDPTPANNTTGAVNTPVCQSNVTVTSTNDSGAGTLRQAITDACPGATIDFNIAGAGPHTITLSTGQLVLSKNLTIQNTSGKTIIVSGGGVSRVFQINSGITATIDNLTITNGLVSGAVPGGAGGAIYNDHGTLAIKNSTVSGSTANPGAGIFNDGSASGSASLTIINSTISGNTSNADGGAIYNQGVSGGSATLSITNSTISGNTAKFSGGGVVSDGTSGTASVTITNSTITNNRSDSDTNTVGEGGGLAILGGSSVILRNSIVALNFKGGSPSTTANDIFNSLDAANSTHNLVGNCASCGLTNGTNNNTLGVTAAQINLGPLQNNGGSVQTHALGSSSIALDAGNNAYVVAPPFINVVPITDERGTGFARIRDAADADTTQTVDIGAYEADPSVQDIQDQTIAEDGALTNFVFNIGDSSTAFDSVTATSSNLTLVPNANITVAADTASTRKLTITPAANANSPTDGTATITVTVTKTISGTQVSMTDTFVLTVTEVNNAPVPTNDTVSDIAEDSGVYTIPIATLLSNDTNKGAANESGQTLTLTGVSNPTGGIVSNDASNVFFTPTADFNGAAGFDYTVTDNGTTNGIADPKTGNAHVSFNITAVNDAPSFTIGADQTVNEDAGAQTVNSWATNISRGGGADENIQTLTFHVTNNSNTGLFSVQPAVSDTGVLTYTPAANAFGTAAITLTLQDSGGGTDTSAPQTFNITVNPVADTPSVTNASTFVNLQTSSGLQISRNGADGAEVGFFKITNIQNGTLFKNDGTTQISNGNFITFAEGNAGLKFTPVNNSTATGSFDVQGSIDNAGTGLSGATTPTITVSKSGTTTDVTSSANPSYDNQTVTFTAAVTSNTANTAIPTGNVTFKEGANTLCSNVPLDGAGKATCPTSTLTSGGSPYFITADYGGDAQYDISSSSGLSQQVKLALSVVVNDTGDTSDNNIGDGICADLNGKCTLRAALQETNAIPSDDAISFDTAAGHAFDPATAPHAITLDDTNGALPAIDGNLTITGPGANTLTVQRSSLASSDIRIFAINHGKTVSISGLTMSGGKVSAAGGGILNNGSLMLTDSVVSGNDISSGSQPGGGIFNGGTLIVTNTTVSGNTGGSGGGAGGGGIFNSDTLKMTNSTVSGNSAGTTGPGGGIYNTSGTLTLINATVSGNTSPTNGGGIYNGSGTATLTNVTVTNNRADNDNDTVGTGGGINVSGGTLTLHNTIVFGNFKGANPSTTADDIAGTVDAASSFNLIGTGGAGGLTNGTNNNQVGVADARLDVLADNGGPTRTHALLAGSPALDAGDNAVTGAPLNLTTDQRGAGFNRSVDGPDADATATVDIGAFEAQVSIEDITDKTTSEDTPLSFQFNTSNGVVNANVTVTSSNTTLVPNNVANLSVTGASSPFTLNISPASNQSGTSTITVMVTVGGQVASDTFVLTVAAIADTPSVANITTLEDMQSGSILVSRNASDGAEVSYFKVTGITNGTLFLNDGVTQVNNNDFVPFGPGGTTNLKFTPAANLNSPGSAFGFTVQAATGNMDAALGGGTATSTITVTAVNDAPSFTTTGNPPAVNEDSGAASVTSFVTGISPGPADEAGQTVSFIIVTNSNTGLFSSQPAIDSTGKLTYTPAADQNGTATITYHAQDSGSGTAPNVNISSPDQTFTITVNAVNDTPSFTKGADQTVFANSGAQTVNPWATAISAGPANESSQVVDFIVSNNNNGLFSVQPAVSPTGVLTYTPATNQTGTALVTVQIHDNGGGADTSASQTFNITVNKSGTTTALVSSINPSFTGQTVTFTATVTSNTAVTGPPTGTVQFFDGVNPLTCSNGNTSTETLDGTGNATCQASSLSSAGSPHSISAVYSGDGAYNGSTSNTVSQTVKPVLNLTVNDTGDTSDANLNDGLCADVNNKCTLRAAIEQTNFASSDDTIGFNLPANSTITLNTALPAIDGNLVINGPGANTLTVHAADGAPNIVIFKINSGKVVTISGLTISNGNSFAGGIANSGTLTVNNSTISANTGINGGGIDNFANNGSTATVTVTNSTISHNSGGGIYNSASNSGTATVTVTSSTISSNFSLGGGGGIFNGASNSGTATVTVTSSTISGNSADVAVGGGIYNNTDGTGSATTKLSNTIVAGNFKNTGAGGTIPIDISNSGTGTVDPTSSFNLIGTGGSGGLTNGVNNNQVGVADARLAPLAFNGGTTQTQALLPGSPALDAGSNTLATNAGLTTDQRGTGFNRSVDGPDADTTATTDIGAFEAQPSIEDITDKSTNEDTALPTFNFNVADGGVSGFTVTATSSNTTLVPNGNINIGGAGQTRSLSINPAANEFGTTTISVTVSGTVGATPVSMTDTFVLTVSSVNDAPTFTPGSNQTVNEDAGAQSVTWATNVSPGPANESGQTVAFNVTNNNNALFSVQPSISPTGTLTYTPASNASGTATVSVTLMDNGGTANGGQDTSGTVQFTITVNSVNDAPVNSVPGPQSTARNTDLAFSTANGNLISISDTDAGANQVKVTLAATNGKLTLSGTTGLTFTPASSNNDGVNDATLIFTGTITNINNALNGLVFSPTPGFDGAASIQITTDDQGNSGSGGAQTDTDTINITVNKGGVLAFSSATYSVSESGGSVTITVNRIGGSSGTTKIDYATSNGTATAGADYTAASGTLTFGNGETSKTFNVPILEDALNEANETVNLTLSNVQGSGDLGTPSTAVLTINDNDPQPSLSINDVSKNEGNSGTTQFTFTVTLSAVSGQNVSVNFATADGTATTADSDYQAQAGTLTFVPGETTKTITVLVNGDAKAEADENFFVNLSGAVNATISDSQGLGTIVSEDTPLVGFSASSYTVAESGLHATITVNRLGDTSKTATVDYATSDPSGLNDCSQVTGNASQRCDYATSVGTLRFAPGESSKTIFIPIVNDVYVEGPESFTITLSNSSNADLDSTKSATVNITDDDNGGAINPITDDAFFIRQLYIDFLGREPEPAGLQGWLDVLHNANGQCKIPTDCDRIAVALGFVRSPEFQDRGYFAFRFYVAALGRNPSYAEFIPDVARLSGFLNPAELEANKVAFVNEFMNRQEFKLKYDPTIGDPTSYVDGLLQTAGLPNHPSRNAWIAGLSNNTLTRAQVLRQLIESTEVYTKFYNQAIIVMNYFGFLRRDPDAAYQTWIDIFNHTNDYRVITNGFINSPEYPLRVGP
jgi:Calx-beta domain/Domain of unknown function DUF11/Bacterial Ig domain/Domain of unknown function (DUF4214)